MIFVALGTQKFQLDRLLKILDEYIDKEMINESIFAQIGNSTYIPKNYEYVKFLEKKEYEERIISSDIIITHSGVGTIITAISNEKPIIVFPRLKKYNEHVDDHQLEIANSFSQLNYVLKCDENDDLSFLIKKAKRFEFRKYISQRSNIIYIIRNYLNNI